MDPKNPEREKEWRAPDNPGGTTKEHPLLPLIESVLLIDDNPDIIALYSRMIADCGYSVMTAMNSQESLDALKKKTPDLILLDILMKPEDGWKILKKIREHPGMTSIPVVMLTAKMPTTGEILQYSDSIDDYIMKPVTRAGMCDALKRIDEYRSDLSAELARGRERGVGKETLEEYRILTRKKMVLRTMRTYQYGIEEDFKEFIKKYPDKETLHCENLLGDIEARIKELKPNFE
jgi:CheY-like chemotaxis protein